MSASTPYRCTFYIDYAVPDHLLVLPHLREATTSIRHNSTPEERGNDTQPAAAPRPENRF